MLVSREFAEKNGLAVGGAFSVRRATVHAQMAGIDVEDTRTQVSVTGIFELTAKSQTDLASWSMDNAIFGTISTLDHAREGSMAVGAAALYLVLSGRVRNRLHESGVPLSLGLTRRSVVGQYLCEVLLVATVAFALAVPTSSLDARTMGGIGAGPLVAPRMALGQTLANPTAQSTTAARRAARRPARPPWARRPRARARHPAPAQAGPPPPQVPPLAQGQATARGSRDGGAPRP